MNTVGKYCYTIDEEKCHFLRKITISFTIIFNNVTYERKVNASFIFMRIYVSQLCCFKVYKMICLQVSKA